MSIPALLFSGLHHWRSTIGIIYLLQIENQTQYHSSNTALSSIRYKINTNLPPHKTQSNRSYTQTQTTHRSSDQKKLDPGPSQEHDKYSRSDGMYVLCLRCSGGPSQWWRRRQVHAMVKGGRQGDQGRSRQPETTQNFIFMVLKCVGG